MVERAAASLPNYSLRLTSRRAFKQPTSALTSRTQATPAVHVRRSSANLLAFWSALTLGEIGSCSRLLALSRFRVFHHLASGRAGLLTRGHGRCSPNGPVDATRAQETLSRLVGTTMNPGQQDHRPEPWEAGLIHLSLLPRLGAQRSRNVEFHAKQNKQDLASATHPFVDGVSYLLASLLQTAGGSPLSI